MFFKNNPDKNPISICKEIIKIIIVFANVKSSWWLGGAVL